MLERGINAVELSTASGIHVNTIRNYLHTRSEPVIFKAVQLAHGLGVTLDYIWGNDEDVQLAHANIVKLELVQDLLSKFDKFSALRFRAYLEAKIRQYRGL